MSVQPNLPSRKRLRLPTEKYPQASWYFVTLCCYKRQHFFGKIENGQMIYSEFGVIAERIWTQMFFEVFQSENIIFQFMPDHFHALIYLEKRKSGADKKCADGYYENPEISNFIGAFKSRVSVECLRAHKQKYASVEKTPYLGKIWLRSFHERIIRDQRQYENVYAYIRNNPMAWSQRRRAEPIPGKG
ncbi:MAG: hypothetical protein IPM77_07910 [Crocinitomicaceae bacterium]|nr:hypothetical protein [Crocinitomicaceae bacterium]